MITIYDIVHEVTDMRGEIGQKITAFSVRLIKLATFSLLVTEGTPVVL